MKFDKHALPHTFPTLTRRQALQFSLGLAFGSAIRPAFAEEERAEGPAIETVHDRIRREVQAAPLELKFQGSTPAEAEAWHRKFSTQLNKLLGPHEPPRSWQTDVEEDVELEDHRRQKLLLSAPGHPTLPIYLLTPKEQRKEPRPAVLALHGHGGYGYHPVAGRDDLPGVAKAIAGANYDYGRQFVRRGYVVAVPCFTPFGPRLDEGSRNSSQDACGVSFIRLQILGKVLIAENLRDARWGVELLCQQSQVDPQRIGCAGLSYGGRMSMLTSALEPRIQVSAVSGALNVMQERVLGRYSCGAQIIPGLLQYGDVPEIGGLIAPRPCVWEMGSRDGLIKADWAEDALQRIAAVYRAFGKPDNLQVDRFDGSHRWNGDVAFPLFDQVLKPNA